MLSVAYIRSYSDSHHISICSFIPIFTIALSSYIYIQTSKSYSYSYSHSHCQLIVSPTLHSHRSTFTPTPTPTPTHYVQLPFRFSLQKTSPPASHSYVHLPISNLFFRLFLSLICFVVPTLIVKYRAIRNCSNLSASKLFM